MLKFIVIAIALTLLEFAKYLESFYSVFDFRFRTEKYRYIVPVALSVLLQALVVWKADETWMSILVITLGTFIPLLCVDGAMLDRILAYIITVSGISIIDMLGSFAISYFIGIDLRAFFADPVLSITGNLTGLAVLTVNSAIKYKRRRETSGYIKLTGQQYVVIVSGILSCLLILSGIQWLLSGEEMSENAMSVWFLAIACVSTMFIILSIWQTITLNKAENYRQEARDYSEFMKMQERYIQTVIDNDKVIRSFRHDLHSHMTVIRGYCRSGDIESLDSYLDSIEENSGMYATVKDSGNAAVDAILGNIAAEAVRKGIRFLWEGKIPNDIAIEPYDLCTVISNVLRNAAEASGRLAEDRDRTIRARAYVYDGKLYLNVENRTAEQVEIGRDNRLATTKADPSLHGFGTSNVKKVVDKYGGTLKYSCADHIFHVEILM